MLLTRTFILSLTLLLSLIMSQAQAGGQVTVEEYVIHYNAFNSTVLLPEIAKNYNVLRSKTRGVLNVAVRKNNPESSEAADKAVAAIVEASAVNLTKQLKTVEMRKITEGDAIYYIGTFGMKNQETLDFTLQITPQGMQQATEITFRQQFFVD